MKLHELSPAEGSVKDSYRKGQNDYNFEIGKAVEIRKGNDLTIISYGSIIKDVIDVVDGIEDISIRVINMHTIKPLDEKIIKKAIDETGRIIVVEDHNIIGGLGSAVSEVVAEYGKGIKFERIGLKSFSNGYGTYSQVKDANGVGKSDIQQAIVKLLK